MRTVTLCAQHGWASRAGTHDHCVERFAIEGDDSECALVLVALLRVTPGAEPTVEPAWWCEQESVLLRGTFCDHKGESVLVVRGVEPQ